MATAEVTENTTELTREQTQQEQPPTEEAPKKRRGRPPGSKNKPKVAGAQPGAKRRGRPPGSKNKKRPYSKPKSYFPQSPLPLPKRRGRKPLPKDMQTAASLVELPHGKTLAYHMDGRAISSITLYDENNVVLLFWPKSVISGNASEVVLTSVLSYGAMSPEEIRRKHRLTSVENGMWVHRDDSVEVDVKFELDSSAVRNPEEIKQAIFSSLQERLGERGFSDPEFTVLN